MKHYFRNIWFNIRQIMRYPFSHKYNIVIVKTRNEIPKKDVKDTIFLLEDQYRELVDFAVENNKTFEQVFVEALYNGYKIWKKEKTLSKN